MLAFTLEGAAIREGICIGTAPSPGRAQLKLMNSSGTIALTLVPSLKAHGGVHNWMGTVRFTKVDLQSYTPAKKGPPMLMLIELSEQKDDKALLWVTNQHPKLRKYKFIPEGRFKLRCGKLDDMDADVLCECQPGANITITDEKTKAVTRYIWNGEVFEVEKTQTAQVPATPP